MLDAGAAAGEVRADPTVDAGLVRGPAGAPLGGGEDGGHRSSVALAVGLD
jgi:hypothetical protein